MQKFDFGIACVQVYKNYGSAFTNFALYKIMSDYGKSVLLINQPLCSEISPIGDHNFLNWPYRKEHCAPFYKFRSEMAELNGCCDKFLVGSDQLFNYEIYKKIDGFTKLDWVSDNNEKLSYSTSFGINEILGDADEKEDFGRCIRRFSHVSVREGFAEELLKKAFGITATSVLDPVFLCKTEHFIKLLPRGSENFSKNRIFAYVLDPDYKKEKIIRLTSSILGKPCFAVSDMWRESGELKSLWKIKTQAFLKNEEWLACIYHSDFVITDSFHGLCFSLIFEKPFLVLYNELRGNDRFLNLLDLLGLKERLILKSTGEETIKEAIKSPVNFKIINARLKREEIFSRVWLERYILGK